MGSESGTLKTDGPLAAPAQRSGAMPTYYFEAMDQTGQEIKDVVEAPSQEEAQATIKQMGYFVTKLSVKKSRQDRRGEEGRPQRQDLRHRRGQVEGPDHLHPPALDPSGRRPAHPPQPENSRTAGHLRRAEELADRRLRRDRGRGHALRGHGQVPQGLQPPLRQHDQGRRGRRRLEVILKRLAEFQERSESLKRKVKGAMVYPIVVMSLRLRHLGLHHV